ncbi:MAG: hypothetical protein AB8B63_01200 [Granulosicoccus sp.]
MFNNHSRTPNSRFAWLTPLDGHDNSSGPWLLTDDDTFRISQGMTDKITKVSVKGLLDLMMQVLDIETPTAQLKMQDEWKSICGRYNIRWHKQVSDTSRLFIQQRSDYFARIELYIDEHLIAAYQEPVWPHLQRSLPTPTERLPIPADCLQALQSARVEPGSRLLPQTSAANQDDIDLPGDSTQAA